MLQASSLHLAFAMTPVGALLAFALVASAKGSIYEYYATNIDTLRNTSMEMYKWVLFFHVAYFFMLCFFMLIYFHRFLCGFRSWHTDAFSFLHRYSWRSISIGCVTVHVVCRYLSHNKSVPVVSIDLTDFRGQVVIIVNEG